MTDKFEPIAITVNSQAKLLLNKSMKEPMYMIHAKWLLGLYDHLQNSCESIINGFKMGGINNALSIEPPSDQDPFSDLVD